MKLHTVLTPSMDISMSAINFARNNFVDNHMGYCLGNDGHLPHITLIQTECDNINVIKILHDKISRLNWNTDNELEFKDYYHSDIKQYCGVEILLNSKLQEIHLDAVKIHQDLGLPVLNGYGDDFWPHMTFAKSEKRLGSVILPKKITGISTEWNLEFGRTGDHGVYLGKIGTLESLIMP